MKVIIGTKNQKKVYAVTSVFQDIFSDKEVEVIGLDADSKVPPAPHDEQTFEGARNRALGCASAGDADYYVGIESGLVERYGHYFEEAWAVVIARGKTELIGYSSGLMLPNAVASRMRQGEKHNEIMADFDTILGALEDHKDTWARYTGGSISRLVSLQEALRNALLQSSASEKSLYRYEG